MAATIMTFGFGTSTVILVWRKFWSFFVQFFGQNTEIPFVFVYIKYSVSQ